jgi:O-antigen/teichoic acid export membrane protein
MVGNASSMLLTSVVTSGLGVVFWWLAARQFPPAAVGVGAAAVSASQLLATLSTLGFGTLLISELPHTARADRGSLVTTALLVCSGVGAALGIAFAYAGSLVLADLQPLTGDFGWIGLFSLAVSGMAAGFVLDQVLVGELRSELQLLRNTIYAAGKLLALFAAVLLVMTDSGLVIFGTWPLANALALAVVFWLAVRSTDLLLVGPPRRSVLRGLGGLAFSHHSLNLAIQMPALVLPVVVTALLSAEQNAYFYTAWMVASVAGLPQTSLATTLYAIGVREPAALSERTRLTLVLGCAAGLAAIVTIAIGGDWILRVFGRSYAEQANLTLRLLSLTVLPLMIKNHYIALLRVQRRIPTAAIVIASGAALEVTGAILGARVGDILGLSIGWLVVLLLETAGMLPTVWRVARAGGLPSERPRGARPA